MTFTSLKYLGDGKFQHRGAHLSLIVFREKTKTCEFIKTKGVYLNFRKDISKGTKNAEFFMEHRDMPVLYTDGLTEAENSEGKIPDLDRLAESVKKYAHQAPEAMKDLIMADVLEWGSRRADDMSIVIVK